jgi:hypothetical protein
MKPEGPGVTHGLSRNRHALGFGQAHPDSAYSCAYAHVHVHVYVHAIVCAVHFDVDVVGVYCPIFWSPKCVFYSTWRPSAPSSLPPSS